DRERPFAALFPKVEGDLLNQQFDVKSDDVIVARHYVNRLLATESLGETAIRQPASVRARELLTVTFPDEATRAQAAVLTLEPAAALGLGPEAAVTGMTALRRVQSPDLRDWGSVAVEVWQGARALTKALAESPVQAMEDFHAQQAESLLMGMGEKAVLNLLDVSAQPLSPKVLSTLYRQFHLKHDRFFVGLVTTQERLDLPAVQDQLTHYAMTQAERAAGGGDLSPSGKEALKAAVAQFFKTKVKVVITQQTLRAHLKHESKARQIFVNPSVKLPTAVVMAIARDLLQEELRRAGASNLASPQAIATFVFTENPWRWVIIQGLITIISETNFLIASEAVEQAQQTTLLSLRNL
ncbi:MAG: hypothetical protein HYZ73_00515, partial [Elusimicrobia bacterium]|nr:hypothetical protein [Elusimicrobiota bacterium]